MGETMLTAAGKREAIKGYFMMTCKDANCPQKEGCVIPENTCNVVIDAMLHPHFGGDHEETQEFWDLRRAICDAIRAAEIARVNEKLEELAVQDDRAVAFAEERMRHTAVRVQRCCGGDGEKPPVSGVL